MTTLLVTAGQQIGAGFVNTAQQFALNYASQTIANIFDNRMLEGPRLDSFHVQTSRDGASMAHVYGRVRLAGQVIWASHLREHTQEQSLGGKGGGPTRRDYSYTVSFAIGLCEGEILSVEQLWANGAPLVTQGLNIRIHKGSAEQVPDPLISAIEGPAVPAFRNTAYIVFEDFPLTEFGNRLPQINAEVLRIPASATQLAEIMPMERAIGGVHLLPGSGEFAYSTAQVEHILSEGIARPLNINNFEARPDIIRALDLLEAHLPNCRSVSLIISWFGSDLRCAQCQIRPGVEADIRFTGEIKWSVGMDERATAYRVSRDEDARPNFGGTPSDASVIEAIEEVHRRGLQVTLYPFILMDIPPQNTLPDPYGELRQAAFPWRGRISASVAPGQNGSPDKTAAIHAEIAAFFGQCSVTDFDVKNAHVNYHGPDEYGFRRFILHYAWLAKLAGGVDRFIIGSEMCGVTGLRDDKNGFPAVEHLTRLAADVRSIVGAQTGLSYAANWSEYFGYHPADGSGDVFFHLDPLWASPHIDAIGIDAYWPLADWRNNHIHMDAQTYMDGYDPAYLSANVQGAEGYDWYYASQSEREAQIRTAISDGAYNKPWVFRYKDIRNWWENHHYDRPGGVENTYPTLWQPQSKPFWFVEIGCPAVQYGANQPNVFYDPKSSESALPYFSDGTRDDQIQRRYIECFINYWQPENGHNPVSDTYQAPMVDMSALHVWSWDARPFPAFPGRADIWSDSENWQRGHWLSGRTGLVPLADIICELCQRSGVSNADTSRVHGLVQGYILNQPVSARGALSPLALVYDFSLVETAQGLRFISASAEDHIELGIMDLAELSLAAVERRKADSQARLKDVRLHFIDASRDYQLGSASARDEHAETVHVLDIHAPLIMDHTFAQQICKHLLEAALVADQSLHFTLSPRRLDVEVGDVICVSGIDGMWKVESLQGMSERNLQARHFQPSARLPVVSGALPPSLLPTPWVTAPTVRVLDMPDFTAQGQRMGPLLGIQLYPFAVTQVESSAASSLAVSRALAGGRLVTPCAGGPVGRWDYGNDFELLWNGAPLAAGTTEDILAGKNRFALQTDVGWEIIQVRTIELTGKQIYRFSNLLRGQFGTDSAAAYGAQNGALCVLLDSGLTEFPLIPDFMGQEISFTARTRLRQSVPYVHAYQALHLRPLSPVHLRRQEADMVWLFSWIRRTRIGGDNWSALDVPLGETREFYQVKFLQNETVITSFETGQSELSVPKAAVTDADQISISQGSELFGFGVPLQVFLATLD